MYFWEAFCQYQKDIGRMLFDYIGECKTTEFRKLKFFEKILI